QAAGQPGIDLRRLIERPGECLEDRLDLVVRVETVERDDVDVHARLSAQTVEEVPHEVGFEVPDVAGGEAAVQHEVRAARKVDGDVRQRLVHRYGDAGRAPNAAVVAQRAENRLPQADGDVFGRVVPVDVEIALHGDFEIEEAVAREERQEMIERAD